MILRELTALARATGNFKKLDEEFSLTNRFRTEVTDTMLAAARLVGARRCIAQSFCGWPFAREGGPVKTEEDPLDPNPPANLRKTLAAIRYLEEAGGSPPTSRRWRCGMDSSTGRAPELQRMGLSSNCSASAAYRS